LVYVPAPRPGRHGGRPYRGRVYRGAADPPPCFAGSGKRKPPMISVREQAAQMPRPKPSAPVAWVIAPAMTGPSALPAEIIVVTKATATAASWGRIPGYSKGAAKIGATTTN